MAPPLTEIRKRMSERKHPHPSSVPRPGLSCAEFRARHAEHLDGLLSDTEEPRWREHARTCLPCARHDRAVRRACDLVRSLPCLSTSEEFQPRLRHRIFHIQDEEHFTRRGSGGHVAVSLAVACLMAALAWTPLLQEGPEPLELAPVEARAPEMRSPGVGATRAGLRVNLFSSEAALPGAWLNGRPSGAYAGTRTLRGPTLSDAHAYPAFLLDPSFPDGMPGAARSPGAPGRE